MRTCTAATIAQIKAHDEFPHFRGRPGWLVAALWDAVHDRPMSLKRERRMCEALGIAAPLEPVEVDPCPDCGAVHNGGRCNGRPVTVRLVRTDGGKRKRYWRPCLPVSLTDDQRRAVVRYAEKLAFFAEPEAARVGERGDGEPRTAA